MEEIAKIGKEQIKEKEYYTELVLEKVENIYEYVICFNRKNCIVR